MKEHDFVIKVRTAARMTQLEVANALGYDSAQFISNIERGLCLLPNDKVRKFCVITKTSLLRFVRVKVMNGTRQIKREILGG